MALTYDVNPGFPPMSPLARLIVRGLLDVDGFAHPSSYGLYGLTPPYDTYNLWHTPSENPGSYTVNGSFPVGSLNNDALSVDWTIVNNGVTDSFSTSSTDLVYVFPQGSSTVTGTLHFGSPYGDKSIDAYYYNDTLGSYGIATGSFIVYTPAEPTFTYSLVGTTLTATNTTDSTNITFVSFLWQLWEGIPGEGGGTLITSSTDESPTFTLTPGTEYSLVLNIVEHIGAVDFDIRGGLATGIAASAVDFSWSQPSAANSSRMYVAGFPITELMIGDAAVEAGRTYPNGHIVPKSYYPLTLMDLFEFDSPDNLTQTIVKSHIPYVTGSVVRVAGSFWTAESSVTPGLYVPTKVRIYTAPAPSGAPETLIKEVDFTSFPSDAFSFGRFITTVAPTSNWTVGQPCVLSIVVEGDTTYAGRVVIESIFVTDPSVSPVGESVTAIDGWSYGSWWIP